MGSEQSKLVDVWKFQFADLPVEELNGCNAVAKDDYTQSTKACTVLALSFAFDTKGLRVTVSETLKTPANDLV